VNYPKAKKTVLCLNEGCSALAETKGRCSRHYMQWRRVYIANGGLKDDEIKTEQHLAKCTKKNCHRCEEIKNCIPHIETPARPPYEWPGAERELILKLEAENHGTEK
jgi:hypothetical protein